MRKYWLITYGCQINKSDSERIAGVLEKTGFRPARKIEEASLIVVNMCSVRQSAVDRVYGQARHFVKLKNKNKKLKIILTGCVLKKDRKIFSERFDYILPIKSLPRWKDFLEEKQNIGKQNKSLTPVNLRRSDFRKFECDYLKIKPKYTTNFSAYIPITIGCNNFCSYCVVPYTRGPEISRPTEDILKEVKSLVKQGYKEIWLLGENVNRYKSRIISESQANKSKYSHKLASNSLKFARGSSNVNFAKLLMMVNDIPGDFWVRFTSSHPKDFSDELIETIARCKKVTKYVSLPVQSGDDEILRKMKRPYALKEYKKLVKKIREKIPGVTLSTDVIVGFPGETKKQFQNTVKLFKEIKPDMAYIAQYSPRPGTAAYKTKDTVSRREKERREKALTEVLKKTALENNKKYIGKVVEVLPEYERKGWLVGKTKEYKTMKFQIVPNYSKLFQTKSPPASLREQASLLACQPAWLASACLAGEALRAGRIQNPNLIGKFVKVKVVGAIPWGLSGRLRQPKLKVKKNEK